jgi:FMN reductase
VAAAPVLTASPSEVFDSFLAVLGAGVLRAMPVLLALNSSSRRQPPDLTQAVRGRLTGVRADPVFTLVGVHAALVPTVVVAGPAEWWATAQGDAERLHTCIDRAAAQLAAAMRSNRQ